MKIVRYFTRNSMSLICVLIGFTLFEHTLAAAQGQLFSGPVSSAMGGAGRAGAEATELIFLNPASASLITGMQSDAIYKDGYRATGEHETSYGLSIVENSPENFAAGGFAYVQKRRTVAGLLALDETILHGAFSRPVFSSVLVGMSFYRLHQKVVGIGEFTQWNGSLGADYLFDTRLGFAYVLGNVIQPEKKVPLNLRMVTTQSIAVHYLFPNLLRMTLDFTRWENQNPQKKLIYQGGIEMLTDLLFVIRMGAEIDDIQKRNALSAGVGFNGPRLRANYSFVKTIHQADGRDVDGAMHSVDLAIPF